MDLPAQPADLYEIEALLRDAGNAIIAGVDEAGRGPLAGPVVVAAAILPPDYRLPGLNDSKKLSEAQREALYEDVVAHPGIVRSVIVVSAARIDEINILQATHEGMREAATTLSTKADLALIDGKPVTPFPIKAINLIKGDGRAACIAAASILAKVTRDRMLQELDKQYPEYGFAKHKGYGTAVHLEALRKHGPCPEHRRSFRPVAEAAGLLPTQGELPF